MSDWNKEVLMFKEKRIDTENLRPSSKGKKRPRPWKVFGVLLGRDRHIHSAATKEAAEAWIEKQARSYYAGRNRPQPMVDAAKSRSEKRAQSYRIVPPKITSESP